MDRRVIIENKENKIDFAPDTQELWIHPEECEEQRLNDFIVAASNDIVHIDTKIKKAGSNVQNLLTNTTQRLDYIKDKILYEKERLQDIIILCNKYTDFEAVIKLTKNDFTGNFTYENNAFSAEVINQTDSKYNITDILGNGYEGNEYVYNETEKKYLSETLDTSKRSAIKDNSLSTYWEYSRITASEDEKHVFSGVNFDAEEARCTLFLHFEKQVNQINVKSDNDDLVISSVYTSSDGATYKTASFTPVSINSKEEQYNHHNYIYSSGVIAFEPTKYVKVTLESGGHTYESIAFEKKTILEDDSKDIVSTETTILNTGRRHVVKINDLTAQSNHYKNQSTMTSRELITDGKVNVISLFCNSYIPEGVLQSDLKFIFTINGTDYDVVPVNSHSNGHKIVRFSQGTMKSDYTQYITEPIKSAKLTVIMKSRNGLTPYINNLKILIGDEE